MSTPGYADRMPKSTEQDWASETEQRVLDAALQLVSQVGWNARLVARAGEAAGLSAADVGLLLPKGADDLAALLSRRHDAAALDALSKIDPLKLKVRERIHAAVEARIDAAMTVEPAIQAVIAWLARPPHAPLGLALGWESADVLWRWAGDTATDENHYTKRAILATVLATTLAVRLTAGHAAASKHLKARIDQVMAFETWKFTKAPKPSQWVQAAASALGRMRYGARDRTI
jgi:ubiquinone biosynthesis protein COQ9